MPAVHGYMMFGFGDDEKIVAEAKAKQVEYHAECGDEYTLAPFIVEDTAACKREFRSRQLGLRLSNSLAPHDVIVIPFAYRAFRGISDLLHTVWMWHTRGVVTVISDLDIDTSDDYAMSRLALLQRAGDFVRKSRGLVVRRRTNNPATRGRFHGRPPFGLCVRGAKGHRHYEIKPEFEVGKMIVKWRLAGHSWEEIRLHLRANRIYKPALPSDPAEWQRTGRPWTDMMIRRAYTGTVRLMNWIEQGKIKDTTKEAKNGPGESPGDGVPRHPQ